MHRPAPSSPTSERQDFSWRTSMPSSAITRAFRERGFAASLQPALELAHGDELGTKRNSARWTRPSPHETPRAAHVSQVQPEPRTGRDRLQPRAHARSLSREPCRLPSCTPRRSESTTKTARRPRNRQQPSVPGAAPRPPYHRFWGERDHLSPQKRGQVTTPAMHRANSRRGGGSSSNVSTNPTVERFDRATTTTEVSHTGEKPSDSAGPSRTETPR